MKNNYDYHPNQGKSTVEQTKINLITHHHTPKHFSIVNMNLISLPLKEVVPKVFEVGLEVALF